jgi:alkanesulfonate monooxygenase SsuD/methylene tetrahydromethanopterin reductase-like flavin-dependent oxidoreductase (luciferase family)
MVAPRKPHRRGEHKVGTAAVDYNPAMPEAARGALTVGVQTWSTDVAALRRYWTAAEALGYDRVTYGDGLWSWTHDGFTMLGALAATTSRIRIGPAVTYAFDAASHHPSWLAKRATTVDHLSGGRLDLRLAVGAEAAGVGHSWRAHGIPYPAAHDRVARLEEAIAIMRALWRGEPVTHAGPLATLCDAVIEPRPLQQPAPPIWVAAMGPAALGVVARAADGWEVSYVTPDGFTARWQRLQTLLAAQGRASDGVRRSIEMDVVLGPSRAAGARAIERFRAARGLAPGASLLDTALAGTADVIIESVARYRAAGVTDLMLAFADFPSTAMLEAFAERVLPHVHRAVA